jgi:hypothetical protein
MPDGNTNTNSKPKRKALLIGIITTIATLGITLALIVVITLPKPSIPTHTETPIEQISYEVIPIITLAELDATQQAEFHTLELINRGTLDTEDKLPIDPTLGDTYYIEATKHFYTLYITDNKKVWVDSGEQTQSEIGEVALDTPKTIPAPATPTADPNAGKTWHEGYWETVVDKPAWTERIDHPEGSEYAVIWGVGDIIFSSRAKAEAYCDRSTPKIDYSEIHTGHQWTAINAYTEYIDHPAETHPVWHEGYWE